MPCSFCCARAKNMIIDCQVHVYERDHPGRPWVAALEGPPEVTGEQMIAAMDAVGVDAAILVSAWTMYRYDPDYAVAVRDAWPQRFALVAPVAPADPASPEFVTELAVNLGAVGIRIFELPADPLDSGLHAVLEAARRHGITVNLLCHDRLPIAERIVAAHPDCQFALDHLGMCPAAHPPVPADVFHDLANVCALAKYENLALKLSGTGSMSSQSYPFPDVWPAVYRLLDAFGPDRCVWGSDWTRALSFLSYQEAVDMYRLNETISPTDLAMVMGGALQKIYKWQPAITPEPSGERR